MYEDACGCHTVSFRFGFQFMLRVSVISVFVKRASVRIMIYVLFCEE